MRDLLNALKDGVIVATPDGRVLFANRSARSQLGWSDGPGRPAARNLGDIAQRVCAGLLESGANVRLDDPATSPSDGIAATVHRFQGGGRVGFVLRPVPSHGAASEPDRQDGDRGPAARSQPPGRVLLDTLVSRSLDRIRPIAQRRGVRIHASLSPVGEKMVAGSATSLGWALGRVLQHVIADLPRSSWIDLFSYAQDDPVLILRAYAAGSPEPLRHFTVADSLATPRGLIEACGGSLGLRCWDDRRLAVVRLAAVGPGSSPRDTAAATPGASGSRRLAESRRLAAELIERLRRTSRPSRGLSPDLDAG